MVSNKNSSKWTGNIKSMNNTVFLTTNYIIQSNSSKSILLFKHNKNKINLLNISTLTFQIIKPIQRLIVRHTPIFRTQHEHQRSLNILTHSRRRKLIETLVDIWWRRGVRRVFIVECNTGFEVRPVRDIR